jgi:hypothetical protein
LPVYLSVHARPVFVVFPGCLRVKLILLNI